MEKKADKDLSQAKAEKRKAEKYSKDKKYIQSGHHIMDYYNYFSLFQN